MRKKCNVPQDTSFPTVLGVLEIQSMIMISQLSY